MKNLSVVEIKMVNGGSEAMCTSKELNIAATCTGIFGTFLAAAAGKYIIPFIAQKISEPGSITAHKELRIAKISFGIAQAFIILATTTLSFFATAYPKCSDSETGTEV